MLQPNNMLQPSLSIEQTQDPNKRYTLNHLKALCYMTIAGGK